MQILKYSHAIASSLIDLGVSAITCVPGYGASETFTAFNELSGKILPYSFHEEPAYSIAHGSSLVGHRSATLMKSHGLTKAGNAFYDSLYTTPCAGFVIIIFEDFDGSHSDSILEIEPWLKSTGIQYLKASKENVYDDVSFAFQISEEISLPVVLLVDSSKINKDVEVIRKDVNKFFNYERNIYKTVVHPYLAKYQHNVLIEKIRGHKADDVELPELPNIPEDLPMKYIENGKKYVPFFDVFKSKRGILVTGDTSISSSFAFPEYNCIDLVTHIGGSIPLAIGGYLAGMKNVWALTGDFGFISAGHYGLIEAVQREIPLKVVIFNNKSAGATGGQQIPNRLIYRLLSGYEKNLIQISDASNLLEIQNVLDQANDSDQMQIVIVNY